MTQPTLVDILRRLHHDLATVGIKAARLDLATADDGDRLLRLLDREMTYRVAGVQLPVNEAQIAGVKVWWPTRDMSL